MSLRRWIRVTFIVKSRKKTKVSLWQERKPQNRREKELQRLKRSISPPNLSTTTSKSMRSPLSKGWVKWCARTLAAQLLRHWPHRCGISFSLLGSPPKRFWWFYLDKHLSTLKKAKTFSRVATSDRSATKTMPLFGLPKLFSDSDC